MTHTILCVIRHRVVVALDTLLLQRVIGIKKWCAGQITASPTCMVCMHTAPHTAALTASWYTRVWSSHVG
jgi:hypothetical protein